jgi:hypothetical protein
VGGLLGVPSGGNRGNAPDLLPELEAVSKDDNVHYTEEGYKNLCNTIVASIEGIKEGSLTKTKASHSELSGAGGGGAGQSGKKTSFFWRGFASPVGITAAAAGAGKGGGVSRGGGPNKDCSSGRRGGRGKHFDGYYPHMPSPCCV